MKVRLTLMLCSLISVSSVLGQTLKIGPNPSSANSSAGGVGVSTFVDPTVPATANGTAMSATFTWAADPCPNAAKIKFFHRTGNTLTLYDERGPFSVTVPTVTVALTPPVNVQ